MTALEPGLYRATVRGVADVEVFIDGAGYGRTAAYVLDHREHVVRLDITDARPLTVIDISTWFPHRAAAALKDLRGMLALDTGSAAFLCDVLEQIEAQSKPARISEPAWGAIVEAHSLGAKGDRLRWVKGSAGWTNLDATGEFLNWIDWDCLIDPVLIRDGVIES